jgi:hypothetical protein
MRVILSAGLVATLLGSAALGASVDTPLPAGKPAGIKAAQLDVTDTAVIATTAAILVAAVVLGVTQKGYTSSATTTSASTSP